MLDRDVSPGGAAGAQTPDVGADLDELSAGALRWIRDSMGFLDPASAGGLPETEKVKASLELALLRRIWAQLRPDDDDLGEVSAFVEKIWRSPAFPRSIAISVLPQSYRLIYSALTPPGVTSDFPRAALEELAADGYLTPDGMSPYLRLETKFYAELAGASHGFESYAELAASGIISKLDTMRPITEEAVYELTHTIFYLSDFGFRNMDLPPADCERTLRFIERLTDKCVQRDYWDMTGELIWTQFCLGGDPAHSASGTAGIRRLRQVQLVNGAIPGRSAGRRPEKSATPVEFFRKVYHTTLVTALVSRVLSSAPQTVSCLTGYPPSVGAGAQEAV